MWLLSIATENENGIYLKLTYNSLKTERITLHTKKGNNFFV